MPELLDQQVTRVYYPNLNASKPESYAAVNILRLEGNPTAYIIVTDESESHGGTSITNAAEYVYQAAYAAAGYPNHFVFLETYPPRPGEERRYDVVTFPSNAYAPDHYGNVRYHNAPKWTPAPAELLEKLGL